MNANEKVPSLRALTQKRVAQTTAFTTGATLATLVPEQTSQLVAFEEIFDQEFLATLDREPALQTSSESVDEAFGEESQPTVDQQNGDSAIDDKP
ncbi:MAG: hypothetical protein H0U74_23620 [Bradymonadaceae bacterium]|nr:hypothetical protein [Lujinxingiaceae bacterium]